jgi:hypothetical protein
LNIEIRVCQWYLKGGKRGRLALEKRGKKTRHRDRKGKEKKKERGTRHETPDTNYTRTVQHSSSRLRETRKENKRKGQEIRKGKGKGKGDKTRDTRHETPDTKHQTRDTRHQTSDTKHQTPNIRHQTSDTRDERAREEDGRPAIKSRDERDDLAKQ